MIKNQTVIKINDLNFYYYFLKILEILRFLIISDLTKSKRIRLIMILAKVTIKALIILDEIKNLIAKRNLAIIIN